MDVSCSAPKKPYPSVKMGVIKDNAIKTLSLIAFHGMKSNSAYRQFRVLISNPFNDEVNPNCHHEDGPDTIDYLPFFQPAHIGQFGDEK